MKLRSVALFFFFCGVSLLNADLAIVEKVEGLGSPSNILVKVKGDKLRVDASPDVTTIFNATTGDMLQLLNPRKVVIRISPDKMKAATELMKKPNDKGSPSATGKITATGRKEKIDGFEAEEYATDTPAFKASYWVVRNYPEGAAILHQLQTIKPPSWDFAKMGIPDFSELPGVPIKTVMSIGESRVTSTITSIKQGPLPDSDFTVPADFKELSMPELGGLLQSEPEAPATTSTPQP